MNINIISAMTPSQSSGQSEAELSVDDDLFQQLLQTNKKPVNTKAELHHSVKQPMISERESDDTEQNLDIVAMIVPLFDRLVEEPAQSLTGNAISKEADKLTNAILTANITTLDQSDPTSTALWVDSDEDGKQSPIIKEQVTPLRQSTHENQPLVSVFTPAENNKQLVELATDISSRSLSLETVAQGKNEQSPQSVSQIGSALQKTDLSETHYLANTDNKAVMVNTDQVTSFIADNHIPSQPLTQTITVTHTMNLSMPANLSQWQASLTEQIVMLTRQDIQTAEIKLHPQELGSLHIKLAMHDDNMQLHMMTAHAVVKGVLESALPFLRTSLEEQGITLQQADVSDFSMMNDSQNSAMFNQAKSHRQAALASSETNEQVVTVEQSPLSQNAKQVGLSIFA